MIHLEKYFQRIGLVFLLFALTLQTSFAEFPVMPEDEYQDLLTELKAKPTLFADNLHRVGKAFNMNLVSFFTVNFIFNQGIGLMRN